MTETRPPPPHDPDEREVLGRAGALEVRQFARADVKHEYFARRGFLHVQLWSEARRVSILTPSRLTRGRFDVWLDDAPLVRTQRWEIVAYALADVVAVPSLAEVRALERWHVLRHEPAELHLLRTWWADHRALS